MRMRPVPSPVFKDLPSPFHAPRSLVAPPDHRCTSLDAITIHSPPCDAPVSLLAQPRHVDNKLGPTWGLRATGVGRGCRTPRLTAVPRERCSRCHAEGGTSTEGGQLEGTKLRTCKLQHSSRKKTRQSQAVSSSYQRPAAMLPVKKRTASVGSSSTSKRAKTQAKAAPPPLPSSEEDSDLELDE